MLKIFQIEGNSLFPLFEDKNLVLCIKTKKPKVGDIVVFTHDTYGLMIKQVKTIKDNQYYLIGTNPDSIDSRIFGFVDKQNIKYKALFKLPTFA